jgi:serine/threonine protein kinase
MRTFLPAGTEVAGYRIESLIGRGGMAVVYRAEHLRLGRKVALKLMIPELAENEMFRQRFIRESRLAAAIDHPNILPIYDAGESEGLLYIAMRYVPGSDLKDLLAEQGRLDTTQTLSILSQVANALDVAHAHDLIHRDVKPGNVLLTPGPDAGEPYHAYLSDFGLTKRSMSQSGLTNTGQFVGTIDYVAPEQIAGRAVGRTPTCTPWAASCTSA